MFSHFCKILNLIQMRISREFEEHVFFTSVNFWTWFTWESQNLKWDLRTSIFSFDKFHIQFRWEYTWESQVNFTNLYFYFWEIPYTIQMSIHLRISRNVSELVFFYVSRILISINVRMWESHESFTNLNFYFCWIPYTIQIRIHLRISRNV